jgi:hypothetical protein
VSEAEFERWIVRVAARNGWCGHHVRISLAVVTGVHHAKQGKKDHAFGRLECDLHDDAFGALDWQFWHPEKGRYMQRELKTERGVVSRHQKRVLEDLQRCGIDAKVWRPSDENEIVATFSRD